MKWLYLASALALLVVSHLNPSMPLDALYFVYIAPFMVAAFYMVYLFHREDSKEDGEA